MIGVPSIRNLVCFSVPILSLLLSIFLIRMIANLIIVIGYSAAVLLPALWVAIQKSNGYEVDYFLFLIGSVLFSLIIAISTIPFWPMSTIMQLSVKKQSDHRKHHKKSVRDKRKNKISPTLNQDTSKTQLSVNDE